jgi:hypothetical protein
VARCVLGGSEPLIFRCRTEPLPAAGGGLLPLQRKDAARSRPRCKTPDFLANQHPKERCLNIQRNRPIDRSMTGPRNHRHRRIRLLSIAATLALAAQAGAQTGRQQLLTSDDGVCVQGSSAGYSTGLGVPFQAVGFQVVSINAPVSRIIARAPSGDRIFYDQAPRVGDSISVPNNIGGNLIVNVFTSDGAGHGGAVCFKAQFRR